MNYKVLVDFRERHENSEDKNIIKYLEKNEIPYELTHLPVGDYICENLDNGQKICVERKIISDLVGSVMDGRLKKELLQMENSYNRAFVIVVGDWKNYYFERKALKKKGYCGKVDAFNVNHRLGILASLNSRYEHVRLIQVENDNQFVLLLPKLLEKSTDGHVLGDLFVLRNKTKENIYFNVLTSFPNVASEKGSEIMKKYPTFNDFYTALKLDKLDVDGVGEKTILAMKEALL